MNQERVVVHGAVGTQGSAIALALRGRGWHVVGLGRRARRHCGVLGVDLSDPGALAEAYRGAHAVALQLPLEFDATVLDAHVATIMHAVDAAGINRVAFNANMLLPPEEIGVPFVDARVRLARWVTDTVPAATVVAPLSTFMENIAIPASMRRLRVHGELAHPFPADLRVPWLALADLAALIADALQSSSEPPSSRVIAGPQALTGPEAAAALAASVGRPVRFIPISHVEFEAMLAPHLGHATAAGIAAGYAEPAPPPPLPGNGVRGTTTLAQWAETAIA